MKTFWLPLLLFVAIAAHGQTPSVRADPPFRLNFQVNYSGSKTHPELAALIYKALRALPGVGIVDREPDAILLINENISGNQYACSLTILTPETPLLRLRLQSVLDGYDSEQNLKDYRGEATDKASFWRVALETQAKSLPAMFSYEGGLVSLNQSAKVALELAIKSLDVSFVEKQRRAYDYSLAHPVMLDPIRPPPPIYDPTPALKPVPQSWTAASSSTPLLLGPDPFPSKR